MQGKTTSAQIVALSVSLMRDDLPQITDQRIIISCLQNDEREF